MRVIDPKNWFEDKDAFHDITTMFAAFANSEDEDIDGLLCEVKNLEYDKAILGENLKVYLDNHKEGFTDNGERNLRIDVVWAPLLDEHPEYLLLCQFLRRALSIFHGTATVEGAMNVTRNILGILSH